MIERPNHVRVVNGTDQKIVGRYDGVDYEFRPKEKVDVPQVVARHIFGFGDPDKTRALTRLGWMFSSDQHDAAMSKLKKISFSEAPALVAVDEDLSEDEEGAGELVPAASNSRPVSPDAGGGRGSSRAGSPPIPAK